MILDPITASDVIALAGAAFGLYLVANSKQVADGMCKRWDSVRQLGVVLDELSPFARVGQ